MAAFPSPLSQRLEEINQTSDEYERAGKLMQFSNQMASRGDCSAAVKIAEKIPVVMLQEVAYGDIARHAAEFGFFKGAIAIARRLEDSSIRNHTFRLISENAALRGRLCEAVEATEIIQDIHIQSQALKTIQEMPSRYLRRHSF